MGRLRLWSWAEDAGEELRSEAQGQSLEAALEGKGRRSRVDRVSGGFKDRHDGARDVLQLRAQRMGK